MKLHFTLLDWGVVLLYFLLVVFLSWKESWQDQDEKEFLLSGRKMTLPAFVATLVSTWYGGILGVGEYSYQFGISEWLILGFPFYVFSAIFAWFLAGKIRQNKALSLPEAIGDFYGENAGRISAIPIFILVSPAPYLLMLGLIFQYLTGSSGHFLIYAAGVAFFSVLYISFGGFSAVTRTDELQVILMYVGFILLLVFAWADFGSLGKLWQTVPANYRKITGGRSLQYILVWFFIALWTFVDPSFHQRAAAAKTPKTAQRGILISIVMWTCFDFLTAFGGMYGWAILGGHLSKPLMVYPYLGNKILPMGIRGLFFVAMLATIMSTLDSYLFLSGQTLGRDLLVKLFPNQSNNLLTRISVVIAAIFGIFLVYVIGQSVINLWYVIGSVMIPGLLIPVLGVYFRLFTLKKAWVLPTMIGSILVSLVWLALGYSNSEAYSYSFLGIQPFYPGLFVSIVFWIFGRARRENLFGETAFTKEKLEQDTRIEEKV
ncbi:MAG TPA: sodium:solute symporter family protein [Balneolaceae bacterium]|nr:sodium:solute symporter family protein [Balneolaceae bacterium]